MGKFSKVGIIMQLVKIGLIIAVVVGVIYVVKSGILGAKINLDFSKMTSTFSSDSGFAMSKSTKKAQMGAAKSMQWTKTFQAVDGAVGFPLNIFTKPFTKASYAVTKINESKYELMKSTDSVFQKSKQRQAENNKKAFISMLTRIAMIIALIVVLLFVFKLLRRPKAAVVGVGAGAAGFALFGRKKRKAINARKAGQIGRRDRMADIIDSTAQETEPEPAVIENQGIIAKAEELGFQRARYASYDDFLSSIVSCASPIVRKSIDKSLPLETQVAYVLKRTEEGKALEEQERAQRQAEREAACAEAERAQAEAEQAKKEAAEQKRQAEAEAEKARQEKEAAEAEAKKARQEKEAAQQTEEPPPGPTKKAKVAGAAKTVVKEFAVQAAIAVGTGGTSVPGQVAAAGGKAAAKTAAKTVAKTAAKQTAKTMAAKAAANHVAQQAQSKDSK